MKRNRKVRCDPAFTQNHSLTLSRPTHIVLNENERKTIESLLASPTFRAYLPLDDPFLKLPKQYNSYALVCCHRSRVHFVPELDVAVVDVPSLAIVDYYLIHRKLKANQLIVIVRTKKEYTAAIVLVQRSTRMTWYFDSIGR